MEGDLAQALIRKVKRVRGSSLLAVGETRSAHHHEANEAGQERRQGQRHNRQPRVQPCYNDNGAKNLERAHRCALTPEVFRTGFIKRQVIHT